MDEQDDRRNREDRPENTPDDAAQSGEEQETPEQRGGALFEDEEIRGGELQDEAYYREDPNLPDNHPGQEETSFVTETLVYIGVGVALLLMVLNWGFLAGEPASETSAEEAVQTETVQKDLTKTIERRNIDAPGLDKATAWINTDRALNFGEELEGQVVLLDFWTYGCINCLHMLPKLKSLEERFSDWPFQVIGVHSPEFDHEKNPVAVEEAVRKLEISHPVAVDSEFEIWDSYNNRFWPTFYLISPDGKIIKTWIGETDKSKMAAMIERSLDYFAERDQLADGPLQIARDDRKRPLSQLAYPSKVLADPQNNRLFIADTGHNRIIVTDLNGRAQRVIGSSYTGQNDGSFEQASFDKPHGMALDRATDTLYIADTGNHLLRAADLAEGTVRTVAGTGEQLRERARGSDQPLQQKLTSPWALELIRRDGRKQLYIAMAGNHTLWRYLPAQNRVEHYAGSGGEGRKDGKLKFAELAQTSGLALMQGSLYMADSEVNAVRRLNFAKQRITTPAGGRYLDFGDRDGVGDEVRFAHPLGAAAGEGLVYVADTYNHKIKTLNPASRRVKTLIGDGNMGSAGGPFTDTRFNEPGGLDFSNNTLWIADTNNHEIRKANLTAQEVTSLDVTQLEEAHSVSPAAEDGKYPGESATAEEQTSEVSVDGVKIREGYPINIALNLQLPEGYRFNEGTPLKVHIEDPDGLMNFSTDFTEIPPHKVKDIPRTSTIPTQIRTDGGDTDFTLTVTAHYHPEDAPESTIRENVTFNIGTDPVDDPRETEELLELEAGLASKV